MSTTQAVPQVKDTAIAGDLYMSFELGDKKWTLTASDGGRGPSRYNVDAGDTAAVAHCIVKARERCKLEPQAQVHSCYEAGRDGWWLHRWLIEQGVDNIQPQAKTGRLKILAIAANHRNAAVPDLPTSTEQGLPDFQIGSWNAIVAPAGTSQAQVEILNQALARALKRPAVVARLAELGIEPMATGVPAYLAHVKSETAKWSKVIKAAGTKLD